jgi:hypothetical protein
MTKSIATDHNLHIYILHIYFKFKLEFLQSIKSIRPYFSFLTARIETHVNV